MPMIAARPFMLAFCCLMLTACAGRGGPGRDLPPPGARMDPRAALVFISPMGEPFRVAAASESALDVWFNRADADGDHALSQEEFLGDARVFFARLDANRDVSATSSESTDIWQREAPEMLANAGGGPLSPMPGRSRGRGGPPGGGGGPPGGGGGPPGGGGGPPGGGGGPPGGGRGGPPGANPFGGPAGPMLQGAQRFGLLGDIEPVMSCDVDLSRRVTASEYEACATTRFSALDTDHDGRFARTEARLWRERASDRGRP